MNRWDFLGMEGVSDLDGSGGFDDIDAKVANKLAELRASAAAIAEKQARLFADTLEKYRFFIENTIFDTEEQAAISVAIRIALLLPTSREKTEYGAGIYRFRENDPESGESRWRYSYTALTPGKVETYADGTQRAVWDGRAKDPLFDELLFERSAGRTSDRELVGELHSHPLYAVDGTYGPSQKLGTDNNQFSGGDFATYKSNSRTLLSPTESGHTRYSGYLLTPNGNLRAIDGAELVANGNGPGVGYSVRGAPTANELMILGRLYPGQ